MKTWTHISVNPIAGALGAEVGGVHLGELGDGALDEVRAAFVEHQVLFFRDQEITRDQHKAFGRRFGTLQIHPYLQPLKDEGHPEFVVLQSDEQHPYLAEAWHSDVTFMDEPPLGSVLKCVVAPEFGGDTMWASMYAAYEALSDKMQRMLSDLVAIHDTATHLLAHRLQDRSPRRYAVATSAVGGASSRPHSSGERTQGLVRQFDFHRVDQRNETARECGAAELSLPAYRDAGFQLPLPMASELGRDVG